MTCIHTNMDIQAAIVKLYIVHQKTIRRVTEKSEMGKNLLK